MVEGEHGLPKAWLMDAEQSLDCKKQPMFEQDLSGFDQVTQKQTLVYTHPLDLIRLTLNRPKFNSDQPVHSPPHEVFQSHNHLL